MERCRSNAAAPTRAYCACRPADLFALRQAGEEDELLELQASVQRMCRGCAEDLRMGGCVLRCRMLQSDPCVRPVGVGKRL